MKKLFFFLFFFSLPVFVLGSNNFEVIPESKADIKQSVGKVTKEGGKLWENYEKEAQSLQSKGDLGAQFASGIFTRDTLLDYIVYLVRFLSQIGLVAGAAMIIYAGYLYSMTALGSGNPSEGNKAIKNAIYGVLVVIFSYAIIRILTAAFL